MSRNRTSDIWIIPKANQLVTSAAPDGKVTKYAYDAAGRMVKEGKRTYRYGYLDKVLSVKEGKNQIKYGYHVDGQLATVTKGKVTESFTWDGLALVKRGTISYVNEPHSGGGAPVASSDGGVMFNDILGTTLGVENAGGYAPSSMTAFGDTINCLLPTSNFFTGKPHVDGLGHVFLLRNYRADLGKWPTADPLGYPDGWNQMAYGVNSPYEGFDLFGAYWLEVNASCWINKTCTDVIFIYQAGSSLHTGIPRSLFSALFKLVKESIKGYNQSHPNLDDLVNSYSQMAVNQIGSDPITPTIQECLEKIKAIMDPLGYEWTYEGNEMFSVNYEANALPNAIEVMSISVLWKIKYKYLKWVEE